MALAEKGDSRSIVRQRLTSWLKDPALAGLRNRRSLATLPEKEREQWCKLWADVTVLLQKVEQK